MADLVITSALVKPSAKARIKQAISGGALVAGAPIYIAADKTLLLSDANGAAEAQAVDGIALTASSAGQPALYAAEDPALDLGVTVGSGQTVILSANAGKIAPDADAASGSRKVVLGVGIGGTKIAFKPVRGGVI